MGCVSGRAAEVSVHEDVLTHRGAREALQYREDLRKRCEKQILSSLPSPDASNDEKETFGKTSKVAVGVPPLVNEVLPVDNTKFEIKDSKRSLIIFDWDDTLCPSTWARQLRGCGVDRMSLAEIRKQYVEELSVLSSHVVELLSAAQKLGKVVIVTNSVSPWVDMTCSKLMPEVMDILHDIPVFYAMSKANASSRVQYSTEACIEAKARAMQSAIAMYYMRGHVVSNVISIGDSNCERHAVLQVAEQRPLKSVGPAKCCTKTVKMLEHPSLVNMVHQQSIVSHWLSQIVQADSDVDIDFSASLPDGDAGRHTFWRGK